MYRTRERGPIGRTMDAISDFFLDNAGWFVAAAVTAFVALLIAAHEETPQERDARLAASCDNAHAWLVWGDARGADLGHAKIKEWCE